MKVIGLIAALAALFFSRTLCRACLKLALYIVLFISLIEVGAVVVGSAEDPAIQGPVFAPLAILAALAIYGLNAKKRQRKALEKRLTRL